MERACRDEAGFEDVPPSGEDTGDVNWLISDALHLEVPVPQRMGTTVNRPTNRSIPIDLQIYLTVPADFAAHGIFDERATATSTHWLFTKHRA